MAKGSLRLRSGLNSRTDMPSHLGVNPGLFEGLHRLLAMFSSCFLSEGTDSYREVRNLR